MAVYLLKLRPAVGVPSGGLGPSIGATWQLAYDYVTASDRARSETVHQCPEWLEVKLRVENEAHALITAIEAFKAAPATFTNVTEQRNAAR